VLYGYLMACNAADIPFLSFPRDEIIEVFSFILPPSHFVDRVNWQVTAWLNLVQIIPASYNNEAKRIHIPDLPPEIIPVSPEDIKIPVPPSVVVSPMLGGLDGPLEVAAATPQSGLRAPRDPEKILQHHAEDVV